MGRFLVPAAMVASGLAFAVAAIAAGSAVAAPRKWAAAVLLTILGGIVPMVFAVTIRIFPVFARQAWRSERLLRAQVAAAVLGGWLTFVGVAVGSVPAVGAGRALALLGGASISANVDSPRP